MDTSPEYVKMCEKAVEIHPWPLRRMELVGVHGNFLICPIHRILFKVVDDGSYVAPCDCLTGVWLPRQDQLQKLLNDFGPPSQRHEIEHFMEDPYAYDEDGVAIIGEMVFGTWEQLWLGLVMKEKFGKVWDGEAWTIALSM